LVPATPEALRRHSGKIGEALRNDAVAKPETAHRR